MVGAGVVTAHLAVLAEDNRGFVSADRKGLIDIAPVGALPVPLQLRDSRVVVAAWPAVASALKGLFSGAQQSPKPSYFSRDRSRST